MNYPYQETTIGQLCRGGGGGVQTGPFGSQLKASAYVAGGIPTIMPANLIDFRVNEEGIARISDEDHKRLTKYQLRPGDIVYGRRGDIGRHALITEREAGWLCGTGCLRIRFGSAPIEPRYISYYLRQSFVIERILGMAVGSTMPNLNTSILESVPVLLPPLPIQLRIAEILGRLDDKIEVNRRINRTLEAMAQALYQHWFVDFGPFQAGEFVESALGLIPQGWRVERMGNCVEVVKGLSYKGAYLAKSGMPLHNLNSIYEGGGYKYEGIKYYNGEYKPRHIIEPEDVIVANTEQGFDYLLIGCPAIIPRFFGEKGIFSHHLFRLRPFEDSFLSPYYLYCLLKDEQFRSNVTAFTNGTTVNMLSADGLNQPQIIVPSCEVSKRFKEIVSSYFQQMETGYKESQKLIEIRDYLLPKLLSGEIPVEAAMAEVEELTDN